MSNLLKTHQKTDIKFQQGDFILYEPNEEQIKEIKLLLNNNINMDKDFNIVGEIPFDNYRFIIRDFTSIGSEIDELTDKEVKQLLDNGDKQIKSLVNAIADLLNEIAEEMFNETVQQAKFVNSYLNIINGTKEVEKIKEKVNKLLKKNKIDITFDDLEKINSKNKEEQIEILSKINIKK